MPSSTGRASCSAGGSVGSSSRLRGRGSGPSEGRRPTGVPISGRPACRRETPARATARAGRGPSALASRRRSLGGLGEAGLARTEARDVGRCHRLDEPARSRGAECASELAPGSRIAFGPALLPAGVPVARPAAISSAVSSGSWPSCWTVSGKTRTRSFLPLRVNRVSSLTGSSVIGTRPSSLPMALEFGLGAGVAPRSRSTSREALERWSRSCVALARRGLRPALGSSPAADPAPRRLRARQLVLERRESPKHSR